MIAVYDFICGLVAMVVASVMGVLFFSRLLRGEFQGELILWHIVLLAACGYLGDSAQRHWRAIRLLQKDQQSESARG
jgi:hypothetical protein